MNWYLAYRKKEGEPIILETGASLEEVYRRIKELDPDSAEIRNNRGKLHRRYGEPIWPDKIKRRSKLPRSDQLKLTD